MQGVGKDIKSYRKRNLVEPETSKDDLDEVLLCHLKI